jgi:acetyl esterase/lipase
MEKVGNYAICSELFRMILNSGDKEEHRELAQNLVNASLLPVAVPNYRLSPKNPDATVSTLKHPTHAQDIALALSVIKSSPHLEAVADTKHIYLVGHSCGAHMICTLMLDPPPGEGIPLDPPLSADIYDSIKRIVLVEGIYDLDLLLESFPSEYYRHFVQGAFSPSTSSFAQYSVNHYTIRSGSPISYFVIHSSEDTLVDIPQAEAMYAKLESEYERLGHPINLIHRGFSEREVGGSGKLVDKDDPWKLGDHNEMLKTKEFARLVAGMTQNRLDS